MNRSVIKSLLIVIVVIAVLKIAAAIVGAYFFIPFFEEGKQRSQETRRQWEIMNEQLAKDEKRVLEEHQRIKEEFEEARQRR